MTMTAQCRMSNCRNKAPDGEAMCSQHRDKGLDEWQAGYEAGVKAAEARARLEGAKAMQEADAINRVARALYECEKQRSDHVDRLLSAAKGQPVKFRMEHWDDVADLYRSDAVAAIAALDPAQIAGGKP